jgi:hypothetical protein
MKVQPALSAKMIMREIWEAALFLKCLDQNGSVDLGCHYDLTSEYLQPVSVFILIFKLILQ